MRNAIILVLFASVLGLGFYQYRLLRISLHLAEVHFDEKMAEVLSSLEQDLKSESQLTYLLGSALTRDTSYFNISAASLKDTAEFFIEDFLRYNLDLHGIKAGFQYQLSDVSNSVLLESAGWNSQGGKRFTYRTSLDGYLSTLANNRYFLKIQVPHASAYLLSQLNALTIPSFIFLLLILACSAWIIRTLYWQRSLNTVTSEFINNLTHELKTPVFSIGLASGMLASKTEDPYKRNLIDMIRSENEKLKDHIEKVLSLAYLENRRDAFTFKLTDLEPVLEAFVQDWQAKVGLAKGRLSVDNRAADFYIQADEAQLINALDNLMDNAIKYSLEEPEISLKMYNEKGRLCISVSDKGIGMEEKAMKRVFDKYYRVSGADNLHKVKGFGLGLSYVRQVIKAHKGRIQIKSQLHQGTQVTMSIPVRKNNLAIAQ